MGWFVKKIIIHCNKKRKRKGHFCYTWFVQIFGSKIQNFFHTFFQNNNLFFQTQGYQIGDQYRPFIFFKNAGMKFFSLCTANIRSRLLTVFQTLSPFFRLFRGLENCWPNFKTFLRIHNSVRTLVTLT